jgi:4-carboxymuconolactone decarboxylase
MAFGIPESAHERRGREVGLPANKVEALIAGLPTSFSDEREQVVYEMAMALANSRWVPQGLYDRAVKALGHVGITDVIALMGYYTSVSTCTTVRTSGMRERSIRYFEP